MSRPLLPLKLEQSWVAVDALQVREVLGRSVFVPIPGATAALPGVLSWRGRAIAVLDLGPLAGLGAATPPGSARERTVVVQVGAFTFALPVDRVREVQLASEDALRPVHATQQRFASNEVELDGAPVPVLDLTALIGAVSAQHFQLPPLEDR